MNDQENWTIVEAFTDVAERCRKSYRSRTGLEWWIGALLSAPFVLIGLVLIVAIRFFLNYQEVMRNTKREADKRSAEKRAKIMRGSYRNANIRKQQ